MSAGETQVWEPFGTLGRVLWIGGGQWAGKSTVARLVARRYGLTAYHYDYHDARGHNDRRIARHVRLGQSPDDPDPDVTWVNTTPQEMAAETLAGFPVRFEWALDDLRALVAGRPIIAEGWGLRPQLVVPVTGSPRQMVVMVPTEEFRDRQRRAPHGRMATRFRPHGHRVAGQRAGHQRAATHSGDRPARSALRGRSAPLRGRGHGRRHGLLRPGRAREYDETGRGLYLVEQLACCWGSARTARGKAVWFELSVRPAHAAA
ncbi:hypothetical protein [Nonomuraea recticatena]|uniref:hypothetical protein n=1 Tax=Nonomuraea recticatena TaxID=46178 RepID=UPI003618DBD3